MISLLLFFALCFAAYNFLSTKSERRLNLLRIRRRAARPSSWFLLVTASWILAFVAMPFFYPPKGNLGTGEAGDMFGALTSLFSGLAFAGLIWTLVQQKTELRLQREELSLQRVEVAQTREVFASQRFENTLFGLLEIFTQHVNSIQTVTGISGRPAITRIAESLPSHELKQYDPASSQYQVVRRRSAYELIALYENQFNDTLESHFAPYFRIIYNIFKFITDAEFTHDADADEKMKRQYTQIVRAHLSSSEATLLMFNGLSVYGLKFKPLIEEFGLLKHVTTDTRLLYRELVEQYQPSAFDDPPFTPEATSPPTPPHPGP